MVINRLATKVKELRILRNWTQQELARRSGITRETVASIETNKIKNPSAEIFIKLARAFNIRPEELYEAAGYIKDARSTYVHERTPEELIELAKISLPISIPVYPFDLYAEYGIEVPNYVEPLEYAFRPRTASRKGNVAAFVVDKNCLEPVISPNDIIILDSNADINSGDIIAGVFDGLPHVGKFRKIDNEPFFENSHGSFKIEDYHVIARVIVALKRFIV